MTQALTPSVYYICEDCAEKHGGVWPRDHVATMHVGSCDVCNISTYLVSVSDWNYQTARPKHWVGLGRD